MELDLDFIALIFMFCFLGWVALKMFNNSADDTTSKQIQIITDILASQLEELDKRITKLEEKINEMDA